MIATLAVIPLLIVFKQASDGDVLHDLGVIHLRVRRQQAVHHHVERPSRKPQASGRAKSERLK
jgi:hypothetical protein